MNRCESIQSQMLDFLYDLLDENEVQSLRTHMAGCAGCREALAKAEAQKALFGSAARLQFPGVQFGVIPMSSAPARPVVAGRQRHNAVVRWAVAAVVLLALGGLGIGSNAYRQEHDRLAAAQAKSEELYAQIDQLDAAHAVEEKKAAEACTVARLGLEQLEPQFQLEINKAQLELNSRQLRMSISGPPTVEAGAVNDYQVQIYNAAYQPIAAQISAELQDGRGRQVVAKLDTKPASTPGAARLALPRDLPVSPGCDLQLVVKAKAEGGVTGELTEKLKLVAPVYLTHLATDKPMYQPGETVHFRSLTLERSSLKPAADELRLQYTISTPTGETQPILEGAARVADAATGLSLLGQDNQPIRGIGAGEYFIDENGPGGEYTLTVNEMTGRFPAQQRKFIVNRYQKPRLNKDLEFTRKSYGPGDELVAACKVASAEGGAVLAQKPVVATLKVDDLPVQTAQLQTDAKGAVNIKFQLPASMERGDGTLVVEFNDGGNVESIAKPIPIVLKKLRVDFFPEGGDLVAGVPNRVYFQARTTLDKPAELSGSIVDDRGQVVASAVTLNDATQPGANQGMGNFEFTPETGKTYQLRIESPTGIDGKYPLPEPKADGVVLAIASGVTKDDEPIRVKLQGGKESRRFLIGAYCRGRLMAHERIMAAPGQATEIALRPEAGIGGVYRVTVFEEQGNQGSKQLVPRAERLVYRIPAQRLNLKVDANKTLYVPGEKVALSYTATDEKGKPAPGMVMVSVVDKSVVKLADEKTFRTMPTHFLLTTEVRRPEDLEHADFLLSTHPKAAVALDLLLGVQGWRRFVEQHDPEEFKRKNLEESTQLAVRSGRMTPAMTPRMSRSEELATREVIETFTARRADLADKLDRVEAEYVRVTTSEQETTARRQEELLREAASAQTSAEQGFERLVEYRRLAHIVLPIAAIALLAVCIMSIALSIFGGHAADMLPCVVAAGVSFLLLGAVLVYAWQTNEPSLTFRHLELANEESTRSAPASASGITIQEGAAARKPAKGDELWDEKQEARRTGRARDLKVPGAATPPAPRVMVASPATKAKAGDGKDPGERGNLFKLEAKADRPAAPAPADQAHLRLGKDMAKKAGREEREKVRGQLRQLDDVGRRAVANKEAELDRKPAGRAFREQPLGGGKMRAGFVNRFEAFDKNVGGGRGGADALFAHHLHILQSVPPVIVREYAHVHHRGESDVRSDSSETVYWHPVLVLPDGKGTSQFDLADSVTTFQVLVSGHTLDGRLGAATTDLEVRKPLTVEPKLPIEVTANDKIDVPVAVANGTDARQSVTLQAQSQNLALTGNPSSAAMELPPNGRARRVYRLQPTIVEGDAELRLDARSGGFSDSVVRGFKVVPDGFPIMGTQSDMLEKVARHELVLPETWIPGTLKYQVSVFPSTLADLQKGLEGLLREPNGCFEQTSTTNYPNVLILDYLKESDQAKPEVAQRAQELLARGYQRLTSYECLNSGKNQREGYEWFGGTAPPHEALTAYGLMQFRDMSRVHDVDAAMIERTRAYLMSRRDGKGGFQRNAKALDSFGRAPDHITSAYIVWALTESGKEDDLKVELEALIEQAKGSSDPYFLALVANSLLNRDRNEDAMAYLTKLKEAQNPDGHLEATATSITGSGGRDLQIETTALTVMAWLKAKRPDQFNVATQKAVNWIGQQRGGHGGFGSTQSTILTMKALIAFAKANKKTAEAGELVLYVGDKEVTRQAFAAGAEETMVLDLKDAEKLLKPGKNELRVEMVGKSVFPYTAAWSYRSLKPLSAEQCPIGLKTSLDRPSANEGETVGLKIQVENRGDKGQGMVVAIVGLPAGLTLPEDMKKLKDLARLRNDGTERGDINAWEVRGRELVLYWRDMAPQKKVEVNLELICRVPGEYRGPASRAYLYYNADHKCWVEPLQVGIKAKGE